MARSWSAVLARIGVPTGDGRILAPGGGTSRDLPLPLMWQELSGDGHGGSAVVGRIETLSFRDGMVTATGSMLDTAPYAVEEQLEAGVIGPSVDLDDIEYTMDAQERLVITKWRVSGATLVSIPAFADVSLTLDPVPADCDPATEDCSPVSNYESLYASADLHNFKRSPHSGAGNCVCGMDEHSFVHPHEYAQALSGEGCVCSKSADHYVHTPGLYASAAGNRTEQLPPIDWFRRPDLDRLTPLTVSDTGRVFGHIAGWETCHVGLPGCVTAPHSVSDYAYFHTSEQRLDDGRTLPVGTLVTGPRHADPQLAFQAAAAHYDDLSSAVAKVVAGEDEHGIWVAGWILPGASADKREQFMSSPVSGDWRRVGGSLELIAVCSVNSPGFPVPRAKVAFSMQRQNCLIASTGARPEAGEYTEPVRSAPADSLSLWKWVEAMNGASHGV
jgi:hypothetical protein